jgi:hypothetical protein
MFHADFERKRKGENEREKGENEREKGENEREKEEKEKTEKEKVIAAKFQSEIIIPIAKKVNRGKKKNSVK